MQYAEYCFASFILCGLWWCRLEQCLCLFLEETICRLAIGVWVRTHYRVKSQQQQSRQERREQRKTVCRRQIQQPRGRSQWICADCMTTKKRNIFMYSYRFCILCSPLSRFFHVNNKKLWQGHSTDNSGDQPWENGNTCIGTTYYISDCQGFSRAAQGAR